MIPVFTEEDSIAPVPARRASEPPCSVSSPAFATASPAAPASAVADSESVATVPAEVVSLLGTISAGGGLGSPAIILLAVELTAFFR